MTNGQFSLIHEDNGKAKTKPLSSPESSSPVKIHCAVHWIGEDLWWEISKIIITIDCHSTEGKLIVCNYEFS